MLSLISSHTRDTQILSSFPYTGNYIDGGTYYILTSDGILTLDPDDNIGSLNFFMIGAGASGGNGNGNGGGTIACGANGGNAGCVASGTYFYNNTNNIVNITIGQGGISPQNITNLNGNSGGDTIAFGITAQGGIYGKGGTRAAATAQPTQANSAGKGGIGTQSTTIGSPQNGANSTFLCIATNTYFGGGGAGAGRVNTTNAIGGTPSGGNSGKYVIGQSYYNGQNASNFGSGGGGGIGSGSSIFGIGGSGFQGCVVIWW